MSLQATFAGLTSSWRGRLARRRLQRVVSRETTAREAGATETTLVDPMWEEMLQAFRRCIEEKLVGPEYAVFLKNDLNHVRRYALSVSWVPEGNGLVLDPACGAGYFVDVLKRYRRHEVVTPPYFNLEKSEAPYPDATFDGVLLMEVLEHFTSDPMFALAEINRILKPGGFLFLTTPNIASWAALQRLARYESPYLYGIFTRQGLTDRHNREYSVAEVGRLVAAAGFRMERLEGIGAYPVHDEVPPIAGMNPEDRGDTTFCLCRKDGPVVDRYPSWLYASW